MNSRNVTFSLHERNNPEPSFAFARKVQRLGDYTLERPPPKAESNGEEIVQKVTLRS